MKLTVVIILCIINVVFAKHHHHNSRSHHHFHLADILKPKDNFFSKTNSRIQNIMNKIFEELELPKQFTEEPKIKLLLTMHYDLNNIAEKNFEIYDVLRNATDVVVDNIAVTKIGLDESVREILSENQFNIHELKDKRNTQEVHGTQSVRTTKKPLPGFNDSREFKEFIKGFLGKIKRLTVDDLFKKKGSSKLFDSSRRNLEIWEPPEHIEADWLANNTGYRRIFRGKKTNILTFPFVASVHILEDFACAGSVIGRDLVLTAASCVQIHYNNRYFRENPKTTYVRIGSDWTTRLGESVLVTEIFFNPTYDPKTLKHNLAILRLERTIKFQIRRKTKIRRIEIDRGDGNLPANTRDVVILGWGSRKPNQVVNFFEKLTVAFLDIYPIDECKKIYSNEYVTENNFCAGFMSRGGGACNRDVGAPGVVGGFLVGVVSFGSPVCGALDAPTVYTRVGHYKEWIEPIMEHAPPRYGKPKTTKMTSKALVYYFNTESERTYPHIIPVTPSLSLLRAHEEKDFPEEDVLQEILADTNYLNDSIISDIINQDLTAEFYDIYNTSEENFPLNIVQHPLINKTLYLIPGIHFETTTEPETTTQTIEPTYLFPIVETETTEDELSLRMNKTTYAPVYNAYNNDYYESRSKEKQKEGNDYVSTDSEESRQEYLDKQKTKDENNVETQVEDTEAFTKQYKITQPIYIEATTEDDYSRDVAFEI